MTNPTPKQTAGNNPVLKGVKRLMNSKIFARATELMNSTGEADVLAYVNRFASVTRDGLIAYGKSRTVSGVDQKPGKADRWPSTPAELRTENESIGKWTGSAF